MDLRLTNEKKYALTSVDIISRAELKFNRPALTTTLNQTHLEVNISHRYRLSHHGGSGLEPVSYTHLTLPTIYSV